MHVIWHVTGISSRLFLVKSLRRKTSSTVIWHITGIQGCHPRYCALADMVFLICVCVCASVFVCNIELVYFKPKRRHVSAKGARAHLAMCATGRHPGREGVHLLTNLHARCRHHGSRSSSSRFCGGCRDNLGGTLK